MVYRVGVIDITSTARGLLRGDFKDRYGQECSIQESSVATEECLWLGVDVDLNGEQSARMHLTKALAHELLPLLRHFVRTGALGYDNPHEIFQVGTWVIGVGETNRGVVGRIIEMVASIRAVVQDNNLPGVPGQHVCAWDFLDVMWELTDPPEQGPSRYALLMGEDSEM